MFRQVSRDREGIAVETKADRAGCHPFATGSRVTAFPALATAAGLPHGAGVKHIAQSQVLIRPPEPEDCPAFCAAVRRSRALHAPWVAPKAGTAREFNQYLERLATGNHCGFLVVHSLTGELAGVININDIIRGAFQSASLGYYAFKPLAGRGLMSEALRLVLHHGFFALKLHRLEANIQPGNLASLGLVRKCGFICEGTSRRLLKVRGRWRDHQRWAMLAEEFR